MFCGLWLCCIEHEFARNTVDIDIRSERCRTNLSSRPRGNVRLDHVNADNPLTRCCRRTSIII